VAGDQQLSGGERQRVSLARAILKNAPIIVLGEAAVFMDPENEEKMNNAIAELIQDKAVMVIARRIHSIVNTGMICVLDGGNLAAAGTPTGNCLKHRRFTKNCGPLRRAARNGRSVPKELRYDRFDKKDPQFLRRAQGENYPCHGVCPVKIHFPSSAGWAGFLRSVQFL
jgi:ABC-type multidrug transport system ATPase subunit